MTPEQAEDKRLIDYIRWMEREANIEFRKLWRDPAPDNRPW